MSRFGGGEEEERLNSTANAQGVFRVVRHLVRVIFFGADAALLQVRLG